MNELEFEKYYQPSLPLAHHSLRGQFTPTLPTIQEPAEGAGETFYTPTNTGKYKSRWRSLSEGEIDDKEKGEQGLDDLSIGSNESLFLNTDAEDEIEEGDRTVTYPEHELRGIANDEERIAALNTDIANIMEKQALLEHFVNDTADKQTLNELTDNFEKLVDNRLYWKSKSEGCALPHFTLNPDRPAIFFDKVLTQI